MSMVIEQLAVFVFDPFNIGQQDQFFSLQGAGDLAGDQVGIDVVGFAHSSNADRGDHRDEVALLQGA